MTLTSAEGTVGAVVGEEGKEMGRKLEEQNESWAAINRASQLG